MSSGDSNPAATPTLCVDIQGDGRWMSLVWRELFSPLHALNFGVGGDATQHVLWRLSNGELAHISPKICGGIMAIVQLIKDKLPKAYTLILEAVSSLSHASLLNVDPGFVHSDGSISHQDLYDYLHLTPQGYQAVCQPLHAHLK
ncbi:unnamed protein product, partial [Coregonus sp. 'balchen']